MTTLRAIVDDYIASRRPCAKLALFANQPSMERTLDVVASWKDKEGKVHSHQRLVSKVAKAGAAERIGKLEVADVQTFEELFKRVEKAIGSIRGIGDLAVYDVALHIGAFLRKLPERVYLQRGAREGARALGLDATQRSLPIDVFPAEFCRLKPWEIEDLLCIYKAELGQAAGLKRRAAA